MRDYKMAVGREGVVTALLIYGLLVIFLRPFNTNLFPNFYGKTYANNADLLSQKTNQAVGNFGYGKHALALTFICSSLYNRMTKHTKPPTMLQHSDALIITICLLLSGDIHPCPGKLHAGPEIEASVLANTARNTAVSQVRTGEKLPFDHVQQTNIPHRPRLFRAVGSMLPTRIGGAGVAVAVAGLTEASRTGIDGT